MFALQFTQEETWRLDARCRDGSASLVELFFSEQLDDIARAKAFCRPCPVREACLEAAKARREPWGVWAASFSPTARSWPRSASGVGRRR